MTTITIGNANANAYVQTTDTSGNLSFSVAGGLINASSMSGAVILPSGSTADRPSSGTNGMLRYNNSNNVFEAYVGGSWVTFP